MTSSDLTAPLPLSVPAGGWVLARPEALSPGARRVLVAGALGAHVLAGWALLQASAREVPTGETTPVMLEMIALQPEAPPPAPHPAPSPSAAPMPRPAPRITPSPPPPALATQERPQPVPRTAMAVPPPPAVVPALPEPSALPTPPAPAPPAAVAPAPAPAAPRQVAITETDWVRVPRLEYPPASRHAREEGVVLVRALIDARGVPRQVRLQRSSGFPRLDEEALEKASTARLKPRTENGQPVEFWAVMPLAFELDS